MKTKHKEVHDKLKVANSIWNMYQSYISLMFPKGYFADHQHTKSVNDCIEQKHDCSKQLFIIKILNTKSLNIAFASDLISRISIWI